MQWPELEVYAVGSTWLHCIFDAYLAQKSAKTLVQCESASQVIYYCMIHSKGLGDTLCYIQA